MRKLSPSEKLTILGYTLDDIKGMRAQQWRITNYVLLVDVALAGFVKLNPYTIEIHLFSIGVAFLIFILGVSITSQAQNRLKVYRERVKKIFLHMPEEFHDIWEKLDKNYSNYYYGGLVLNT